jgi:ribosome-binding protein aMBF1 (putative translation factor)
MKRCPTCNSPAPHLHPAMSSGGEVEVCTDAYHLNKTPQNTLDFIYEVQRKRLAKWGVSR